MIEKIKDLFQLFLEAKGVSIDTRTLNEGEIFFALKGPNFDGNLYAEKAIKQGAKLVVIDDDRFSYLQNSFLVDDVLYALQLLAQTYRLSLDIPVVAITGSNGKTTTKELLKTILNEKYITHATKGNLNNHIGVPLTILRAPKNTEVLIVEMGANHKREIDELCLIARPNIGHITNIGSAHLDGFGGIEGVLKGKTELFDFLKQTDGLAILNLDDKQLQKYSTQGLKYLTYSDDTLNSPDYLGDLEVAFPNILGKVISGDVVIEIQSGLPGKYNFKNIVAAVSIAYQLKLPIDLISKGVSNYLSTNNRSQILRYKEGVVLLDAYNANPDSFVAASSWLQSRDEVNKVAILGEMKELGKYSVTAHQSVVQNFLDIPNCKIFLVGEEFAGQQIHDRIIYFTTISDLSSYLESFDWKGKVCLAKGSRSNQLERLFTN